MTDPTTPAARPLPADVAGLVKRLERVRLEGTEELCWEAAAALEAQAAQIADLTARAEKAEAAHRELSLDQIAALDRIADLEAENARMREAGQNLRAFVSVSARSDDAMLLAVSEWDAAAMKGGDNG